MKRIFISFLSLTALLVACNQTPQVVIETTVTGDLSNQMAYLVKAGDKATIVDSVKITGNTFQFKSDFTGKAAYSIALGKDKINTSAAVFVDTIMQYKLTLNADELNKPTQFNVVAKVDGDLENKMIYLMEEGVSSQTFLDSAVVVDHRLVLKSTYTGAAVYSLVYDKKKMPVMIFVEQASPYALTINANDPSQSKVEGLMAKLYSEVEASNKGFEAEVEPLKDALRAGDTAAMAKYRDIQTRAIANLKQFVLANGNTLAGIFVLRSEPGVLEANELDSLKLTFSDDLKQSKMVSRMFLLQKGNPFIDLKLKDPNNNDIAISDYAGKGKVVLLDFWASWCGPCRRENPNVVAVYNKYKSKGFEIVGISMDRNLEDWKKGIAEDKIKWPQMSDLKYWGSEAIAAYDIQGIPFTVLLDGEGKIIATNLRGEDLDKTLASLFN